MATISAENLNVTHRQRELLRYLWQRKQGSVGEIAAMLQVSSPAAIKAVARLERKGLMAREENEIDRRRVRVSLTPARVEAMQQA